MELKSELLELFEKIGTHKSFKKDSILFFEGQKAAEMILLLKGCVRLYKTDSLGRVINIHFLRATNFIAEMPVFEGLDYPASAVCESDCEVIFIGFESFKKHCLQDERIGLLLMRSLMAKIRYLEKMINENFQYDVRMRLVGFLLQNSANIQQFSQKDIAKMINTTPETLSRMIKKLKDEGLIMTIKGRIQILDMMALKKEQEEKIA